MSPLVRPQAQTLPRGSGRRLKYRQLAEQIEAQVRSGELRPGTQLPSFARMQAEYGLSQSTLEKMYRVLEQRQLIVREPGRGIYIAEPRRAPTGVIGLLANHAPESHPYYGLLLAGIREVARRENLEPLLLNEIGSVRWEKVDGVVICMPYGEDCARYVPLAVPRVGVLYPLLGAHCVLTDNYGGTRAAIEHLLQLGHRRIGYITVAAEAGPDRLSAQRLQAYYDALREGGVTVERGWVQPLAADQMPSSDFTGLGRERMRQMLDAGWRQLRLTALLVQNDDAAIGVIQVLQEAGIDVPGQLSVVGFDGTPLAHYFRPRLTTVQVPLRAIGAAGMERLLLQLAGRRPPSQAAGPAVDYLPARLQVGESTGPAPII